MIGDRSPDGAELRRVGAPRAADSPVVLVLHGGNERNLHLAHWYDPPVWWLGPIALAVGRQVGAEVHQLRHRLRGWNETGDAAISDARWAIDKLAPALHGRLLVLLGHSMGGRTAVRVLDRPGVGGAVLLAPWLPPEEPTPTCTDRPLEIVQGSADSECPEPGTRDWLVRAEAAGLIVERRLLPGLGHMMIRGARQWQHAAVDSVQRVMVLAGSAAARPD
jgi:predicted esterase